MKQTGTADKRDENEAIINSRKKDFKFIPSLTILKPLQTSFPTYETLISYAKNLQSCQTQIIMF